MFINIMVNLYINLAIYLNTDFFHCKTIFGCMASFTNDVNCQFNIDIYIMDKFKKILLMCNKMCLL